MNSIYAADFEATVETMNIENYESEGFIDTDKVVVTWAGLKEINSDKRYTFQTRYRGNKFIDALDSFMNRVKLLKDGSIVVFHNLKGYDHGFIYYWALNNGYKVSGRGVNDFFINFGSKSKPKSIRFFDSLNLFQLSIKALGAIVNEHKGGTNEIETPLVSGFTKKTTTIRVTNKFTDEVEYHTFDLSLDKAFKVFQWDKYAEADIDILAKILKHFKVDLLLHNNIVTTANWAWQTMQLADFSQPEPAYNWLNGLDEEPIEQYKFQSNKITETVNKIIKPAYKGGLTYVNPLYQGKELKRLGRTYDYNSMYPYIYSTCRLPKSECKRIKKIKTFEDLKSVDCNELGFIKIFGLNCKLKDNMTMPFLKKRTDDYDVRPSLNTLTYDNEYHDNASLTLLELELLFETYDIESFKSAVVYYHEEDEHLMARFRAHCAYWYKLKAEAKNESERFIAKMMLNSAYGKAAQYTRFLSTPKISLDESGVLVNNSYKHKAGYKAANVAAGAYITAYGRVMLSRVINTIGKEHFVYCDTDSVHVFDGPDYESILPIDSSKLGYLKEESRFDCGRWLAPKTYAERVISGKGFNSEASWILHTAGSGLPIAIESFNPGQKVETVRTKYVKGGRLIYRTEFTLSAGHIGKLRIPEKAKKYLKHK